MSKNLHQGCILRRATAAAFTPVSLSGCKLWLRGDLGITLSGSNVTAWADQSGHGNDGTTGGADPTQGSGIGTGGRPTVAFNGAQYLACALDLGNVSQWVYCVWKSVVPSSAFQAVFSLKAGAGNTTHFLASRYPSAYNPLFACTGTLAARSEIGVPSTSYDNAGHSLIVSFSAPGAITPAQYTATYDGAIVTPGNDPTSGWTAPGDAGFIGGGYGGGGVPWLIGEIGELAAGTGTLTAPQIAQLATYAAAFWA